MTIQGSNRLDYFCDFEIGLQLFTELGHRIRGSYRDADQRQMGGLEDVLHELVAGLAVAALVVFVINST